MKRYSLLFLISIISCLSVHECAAGEKIYSAAPTVLPHTTPAMKTAGFWIDLQPSPDKVILDERGIEQFNAHIQNELKAVKDLSQFPIEYPGEDLKNELEKKLGEFAGKGYFVEDGSLAPEEFFTQARVASALDTITAKIKPRYGLTVHFTDQRYFPTEKKLTEISGDIDFDELQNSDLDVSTPVVVLHQSADGKWLYVIADLSDGWVRSENIALCSREEFNKATAQRTFALVTGAKVDIYLDPAMTKYYGFARMGTKLLWDGRLGKASVRVRIPTRDKGGNLKMADGWLSGDVWTGDDSLPFTARNVTTQAFKLLNAPYGWGGANGEQDCSRFLHEVFSTVGINLPRNSKEQGQVGELLSAFADEAGDGERLEILKKAPGGISILPLKGHIMLYLGLIDGRPYAIHAVWGYRENVDGEDHVRVINRVAVTDLYLGEGSKKGSLLKRLKAVRVMR